jgi:hypothetical protein
MGSVTDDVRMEKRRVTVDRWCKRWMVETEGGWRRWEWRRGEAFQHLFTAGQRQREVWRENADWPINQPFSLPVAELGVKQGGFRLLPRAYWFRSTVPVAQPDPLCPTNLKLDFQDS